MSRESRGSKNDILERRSSFGGASSRRASFGGARLSVGDIEKPQEDGVVAGTGDAGEADAARAARRRKSVSLMMSSGLNNGVGSALADDLCKADGIDDGGDAKSKMETVLKLSKEKGLSSERIFEYFDANGDGKITKEEFKTGLYNLDPIRFKLNDAQIDQLVKLFDKDGDGEVDMDEFKNYCFNMKNLAWKAEKLRKSRASADSSASMASKAPDAAAAPAAAEGGEAAPAVAEATPPAT